MADTGPNLNVSLSPATDRAVGAIEQRAKNARNTVARLREEMRAAAAQGRDISKQQRERLLEAQKQSEKLGKIIAKDREALRHFRTERMLTRNAVGGVRSVAGSLATGNIDGLLGGADAMLSSPRAARLAGKLGLAGLQRGLVKAMPYAFMATEGLELARAFTDQSNSQLQSNRDLKGKFARGEISANEYLYLRSIGGDDSDEGGGFQFRGARSGRAALGLLNENWSTEGRRNQIVRQNSALGSDQRQLAYMRQAALTQNWAGDGLMKKLTPEEKAQHSNMIDVYAKNVKLRVREYEREFGPADENARSRISQEMVQEMRGDPNRFIPENYWFFENLEDIKKSAQGSMDADDAIRRARHPNGLNLSEKYRFDTQIHIRQAQWNEYHRGWVPYNRNE